MGASPVIDTRRRFPIGTTIGVVGLLIGLMGVGLALYFNLTPPGARELQLVINSDPVLVYDPDVTASFSLQPNPGAILWLETANLDDHKVWAINFTIWNSGSIPIKPDHVLSPLQIGIGSPDHRPEVIWELRSINWSREEIKFQAPSGTIESIDGTPRVPLDFRILEEGDGVQMQLIYSGSSDTAIALEGTIEGMRGNEFPPIKHLQFGRAVSLIVLIVGGLIVFVTWIRLHKMVDPERVLFDFSVGRTSMKLLVLDFLRNTLSIVLTVVLVAILILVDGGFYLAPEIPNFSYKPPTVA